MRAVIVFEKRNALAKESRHRNEIGKHDDPKMDAQLVRIYIFSGPPLTFDK